MSPKLDNYWKKWERPKRFLNNPVLGCQLLFLFLDMAVNLLFFLSKPTERIQ